jgi:hypothetical protein
MKWLKAEAKLTASDVNLVQLIFRLIDFEIAGRLLLLHLLKRLIKEPFKCFLIKYGSAHAIQYP